MKTNLSLKMQQSSLNRGYIKLQYILFSEQNRQIQSITSVHEKVLTSNFNQLSASTKLRIVIITFQRTLCDTVTKL